MSAGGACGAFSALVARKIGGQSGHLIGGAVATLIPGIVVGAMIAGNVFQELVNTTPMPFIHLAFGGACGGLLAATLGGWTGKAVAEALDRPT